MKPTEYEKRVLNETPEKSLTFLRTAAIKVEIRAALFAAGYTAAEQALGWRLLALASGYVPGVESVEDDAEARAAIAELDAWDEPGFRRIGAALRRLHPEQHEYVFAGLESASGAGSVLAVATLLDRLDQLEGAVERAAMREADEAAIATLSARGITPQLRQHLRRLIAAAQTAEPPVFPANPAVEARDEALLELRAWYEDWAETARAVIHRRDYLVMLGLASRRTRSRGAEEPDDGGDDVDVDVAAESPDLAAAPAVAPANGGGAAAQVPVAAP